MGTIGWQLACVAPLNVGTLADASHSITDDTASTSWSSYSYPGGADLQQVVVQ